MYHDVFSLEDWQIRFRDTLVSTRPLSQRGLVQGGPITSPIHICRNLHIQQHLVRNQIAALGEPVPVDVFLWGLGSPKEPFLTKLGGTPYRPSDRDWPLDPLQRPMVFIGQICFLDSLDLVREIPGDILLVFAMQDDFSEIRTEWSNIEESCEVEYTPTPVAITPCHAEICRTQVYPEAVVSAIAKIHDDSGNLLRNVEFALRFQATQIGTAPLWIQAPWESCARVVCALSSIQPTISERFPFINREEVIESSWDMPERLMFGDVGCAYFYYDVDDHWRTFVAY